MSTVCSPRARPRWDRFSGGALFFGLGEEMLVGASPAHQLSTDLDREANGSSSWDPWCLVAAEWADDLRISSLVAVAVSTPRWAPGADKLGLGVEAASVSEK